MMHVAVAVMVIVCDLVKVIDLPSALSLRSLPLVDLDPARPPGLVVLIRVSILVWELVPIRWPWDIYLFSAWEQDISTSWSCLRYYLASASVVLSLCGVYPDVASRSSPDGSCFRKVVSLTDTDIELILISCSPLAWVGYRVQGMLPLPALRRILSHP